MTDGLEAFREELLEHFAREQEGAFPWVAERLPAERARVDSLVSWSTTASPSRSTWS